MIWDFSNNKRYRYPNGVVDFSIKRSVIKKARKFRRKRVFEQIKLDAQSHSEGIAV